MPRKHRATSVDGAIIGMQAALSPALQPPWPLDRRHRPVWNEIMERRARGEWRAIDLRFAHQLTTTLVALHDEEQQLGREGTVIETQKGLRPNPRNVVLGQLRREALQLSRYLRVHPSSDGRAAEKHFAGRLVEAESRAVLADSVLDDILPTH